MNEAVNIHSTGFVLGGKGILLRGPSGAGKSLLTMELLYDAEMVGQKAALVADDRIDLTVKGGKLIMNAPPEIGGLIELRGRGIIRCPHTAKAPVHLVVDMVDELIRLVEEDELVIDIEGIKVARCPIPHRGTIDSAHQKLLIREALRALVPAKSVRGKKSA